MATEVTVADVIIIGSGLAALVAACELLDRNKRVIILEQESRLGGQCFWSLGGLFFVDSPEQRRLGVKDSRELAWHDWELTAGFDREEDGWPRRWAEAYVDFAAGEKRAWLHERGLRFFPVVGWAERRARNNEGPGNSVPRFHVTWGTGPGVMAPFERRILKAARDKQIEIRFRHRVTQFITTNNAVSGVRGDVLEEDHNERGAPSSHRIQNQFELHADNIIVASGGIGANHELIRKNWPQRLGTAPKTMLQGVPDHVDGTMIAISEDAGASMINKDRMWHYTEGIKNFAPIWSNHGIRILPGPSSVWLDAMGHRIPDPFFPGFDTLGTLQHIMSTGYDYSWFILTQKIIEKEFALSGSEQNPDLTGKSYLKVLQRALPGAPKPVEAFKSKGEDFIVEKDLHTLVQRMNELAGDTKLDAEKIAKIIRDRDATIEDPDSPDVQTQLIHEARGYAGDRLIRVAKPHRILDPDNGPLIAVRLRIVSRKTLGGLESDLYGRVLRPDGRVLEGLYAAGEVNGFGGGGMHGYRALEGTFLGGCIFSGRSAGRNAASGTP